MSFNVDTIASTPPIGPVHAPRAPSATIPSPGSAGSVPPSPPDEMYSAMAEAQASYDRLADQGQKIHFDLSPAGGVAVTLHDADQGTSAVSPAQVLALIVGWTTMA